MSATKIASTETVNKGLNRLDHIAKTIQDQYKAWGMPQKLARELVINIDKAADELERGVFGNDSFEKRQFEILKEAKVIQKDSDESYMDTFGNPMRPHQTDSDEPYMNAYADDQSSAVRGGKSTTGVPLAK